jgi:cbb3-type cytochrome oxidase maturation protein
MSVLIILIIISVLVAGGFLIAFLWSVNSGQMEDDYTPSVRMLFDDELISPKIDINEKSNLINKSKI